MKTLAEEQERIQPDQSPLSASDTLAARYFVASVLAQALRDPRYRDPAAPRVDAEGLAQAWQVMADQMPAVSNSELSLGELRPDDLDPRDLVRWLELDKDATEEVFCGIFGLLTSSKDCPPYETEYSHWSDPTYRANQMADIAGFYRAFGMQVDSNRPDRVDHASFEIDFIANLLLRLSDLAVQTSLQSLENTERMEICNAALRSFVQDHVAWWMPTFGGCIERRIEQVLDHRGSPAAEALRVKWQIYAAVARLLRAWVAMERIAAGVDPVRRIIAPSVSGGADADDDPEACGSCDSCGAVFPGATAPPANAAFPN